MHWFLTSCLGLTIICGGIYIAFRLMIKLFDSIFLDTYDGDD